MRRKGGEAVVGRRQEEVRKCRHEGDSEERYIYIRGRRWMGRSGNQGESKVETR